MATSQRDALDKARASFRGGDHLEALKQYEHFFDHALDDDPHSLYGVRLSYCLNEWAKLGENYPPALDRLMVKAKESVALLNQTRNPERFHDYIAICRYLKCQEQPIELFLAYHETDRSLANSVVRYIWDQLVQRNLWEVCATYLPKPKEKYDTVLSKFDQALRVCMSDPTLGGDEFEEQIKGWYVRDVANLLLVLKNIGDMEAAATLEKSMIADMKSRGYPELVARVNERFAL